MYKLSYIYIYIKKKDFLDIERKEKKTITAKRN